MKEGIKKLAHARLTRAWETFREGEMLFEAGSLHGAVNRFYYAAFYAARALLATRELDSSKHAGVIKLFHQHFVRTQAVDAEKAKIFSRSFEKRQDSDYEDFAVLGQEEVSSISGKVKGFIEVSPLKLFRQEFSSYSDHGFPGLGCGGRTEKVLRLMPSLSPCCILAVNHALNANKRRLKPCSVSYSQFPVIHKERKRSSAPSSTLIRGVKVSLSRRPPADIQKWE